MKILELITEDLIFTVECAKTDVSYKKAKTKQKNLQTDTSYFWNTPEEEISLYNPEEHKSRKIKKGVQTNPVFFENRDYVFDIEFTMEVENPFVLSISKEITEKFYYREKRKVLAGTLNFGNDIGKSDFIVDYLKNGKPKRFEFQFEVFPTKLDFKNDYKRIIRDIEKEFPYLVLDFLKKTYSTFKTGSTEKTDLIWWKIFGGLFEEFISATEFILNKPNSRLLNEVFYHKMKIF